MKDIWETHLTWILEDISLTWEVEIIYRINNDTIEKYYRDYRKVEKGRITPYSSGLHFGNYKVAARYVQLRKLQ